MKKILFLILFLAVLAFAPTLFIDLADFIYVKFTHKEWANRPLYEEMHHLRYQSVFCRDNTGISSIIKKHIPVGMAKREALDIMKRNGFKENYPPGEHAGRMSWSGWDQPLIMRRVYSIEIVFKNDKVVTASAAERCFAF